MHRRMRLQRDLDEPIRPDIYYSVGNITALITDTPPAQLLRAQISKYDVSKTMDAVESLYFEKVAAKSNHNSCMRLIGASS